MPSPGLGNICEGSLQALLTRVSIILFWPSGWLCVCMEGGGTDAVLTRDPGRAKKVIDA